MLGRDDRGAHACGDQVPERTGRIGARLAGGWADLIPARQLAGMEVSLARGSPPVTARRSRRTAPAATASTAVPAASARARCAGRRGWTARRRPDGPAAGPSRGRRCACARSPRGRSGRAGAPPRWSPSGSCRGGPRRSGSRARRARRTTATSSPARTRSHGRPADTGPHGTPRTGSAARSPRSGSAARGPAGRHPPPRGPQRPVGCQAALEHPPHPQVGQRFHGTSPPLYIHCRDRAGGTSGVSAWLSCWLRCHWRPIWAWASRWSTCCASASSRCGWPSGSAWARPSARSSTTRACSRGWAATSTRMSRRNGSATTRCSRPTPPQRLGSPRRDAVHVSHLGAGAPAERVRLGMTFLGDGRRAAEAMLDNHWLATDELAARLGLDQRVRDRSSRPSSGGTARASPTGARRGDPPRLAAHQPRRRGRGLPSRRRDRRRGCGRAGAERDPVRSELVDVFAAEATRSSPALTRPAAGTR